MFPSWHFILGFLGQSKIDVERSVDNELNTPNTIITNATGSGCWELRGEKLEQQQPLPSTSSACPELWRSWLAGGQGTSPFQKGWNSCTCSRACIGKASALNWVTLVGYCHSVLLWACRRHRRALRAPIHNFLPTSRAPMKCVRSGTAPAQREAQGEPYLSLNLDKTQSANSCWAHGDSTTPALTPDP